MPGQAAVVLNDRIMGQCPLHKIIAPNGSPMPAPPMPFSAPLMKDLTKTVKIGGKPAAVVGSTGINTPPHTPVLHASDQYVAPPKQQGKVNGGSSSVFFDGKKAAYTGCQVQCCAATPPGQVTGSAVTVKVAP
jgi:uncharacterized Zn-binding protein involved in type VI secretion